MGRSIVKSAFLTVATLFGGLLLGFVAGDLVFRLLPGNTINNVKLGHVLIAAIPALAGFVAGGAAWGVLMGRLAGVFDTRRMAIAGMIGFGPITLVLAAGLGLAEPMIVGAFAGSTPIHRIFTLLFVPSAFFIADVSAFAIGQGLQGGRLAISLLWQVGLAAGITFLLVNLIMESLGWVVGAPGAVERATMIMVLAAGNLGAALVGGGLLGLILYKRAQLLGEAGSERQLSTELP